eukprot:scaffold20728_cov132-Isochrysis_galbana.AAC.11
MGGTAQRSTTHGRGWWLIAQCQVLLGIHLSQAPNGNRVRRTSNSNSGLPPLCIEELGSPPILKLTTHPSRSPFRQAEV